MNEISGKLGIALILIAFLAGCAPASLAPTPKAATPATVILA